MTWKDLMFLALVLVVALLAVNIAVEASTVTVTEKVGDKDVTKRVLKGSKAAK